MSKHWLLGVVGAFAVIALVGIGFSALTASATVNGNATSGSASLTIVGYGNNTAEGLPVCVTEFGDPSVGNLTFSGENAIDTSINVAATNLTPGTYCDGYVLLENTGSIPLNLSSALTNLVNICPALGTDCYDVEDFSGISALGGVLSVPYVTTLAPGATYNDTFFIGIPLGSDDGTPASGSFSLVFTGTAGV